MAVEPLREVTTLTFDIFGTVLDLTGSLAGPIARFLQGRDSPVDAAAFWEQWRARQRIEQYQDTLLMLGHSGYLETCRRALLYTLRRNAVPYTQAEVEELMEAWRRLDPYPDAVEGLRRLSVRYRLVALSNGDAWLLEELVRRRINVPFDAVISVDRVGVFKPHPAVYRRAALELGEVPQRIMMVAAHAFDILGARACGLRGAYVNRYGLPYEESPLKPDLEVPDFLELADALPGSGA